MKKICFILFLASCSGTKPAPEPAAQPSIEKKTIVQPPVFGMNGASLVIDSQAYLGRWDGDVSLATNEFEIIDTFWDGDKITGAIGEVVIPFSKIGPKFRDMFEIPIIGTDGEDVCGVRLFTDEIVLRFDAYIALGTDEQGIETELKKSKPWVVASFESTCDPALILTEIPFLEPLLDDSQLEESLFEAVNVDPNGSDGPLVDGFMMTSKIAFVIVEEEGIERCGSSEGIDTKLFIAKENGEGWKTTLVNRYQGSDEWRLGMRTKNGLIAASMTGFYYKGKWVQIASPDDCTQ